MTEPNDLANVSEGLFAIVESLDGIAEAANGLTRAIHRLGNADAATPMGGLEALGAVLEQGFGKLAMAVDFLGQQVGE